MQEALNGQKAAAPRTWMETLRKDSKGLSDIFCSVMQMNLVFVPIGLAAYHYKWDCGIIFAMNWIAIIPLGALVHASIEAVVEKAGPYVGGVVHATCSKSIEMVMCVQCIRYDLIEVVQGNLMGSLHWNLLLILGMSIFSAGIISKSIDFDSAQASAQMTCQILASISIVLPAMFTTVAGTTDGDVLLLSRITCFMLGLVYFAFNFFHLTRHAETVAAEMHADEGSIGISLPTSTALLIMSVLVTTVCSECLVEQIIPVTEKFNIPRAFIGVTVLPIIGNIEEHRTAMMCARNGKMDIAISIAVGSATQIALFVVPCAVLWGWWFDHSMTLNFTSFDSCCMLITVFLASQMLQHGITNWLHGAMLMVTYFLVAVISWFIPQLPAKA
eukprot:TRINITY_DN72961_c0_g1_i1.p1 TRINITY_DN72961_c0_g1~~TRINITY_DN72961_c0_g1_i1.p1  ORF type:complete len:386 (-),score=73.80 TRINITY_DN72961_c0_g1_i1:222-1379(-)